MADAERLLELRIHIPTYGNKEQLIKTAARARDAIQLSVNSRAEAWVVEHKKKKSGKFATVIHEIPSTDTILGKDDIGGGSD